MCWDQWRDVAAALAVDVNRYASRTLSLFLSLLYRITCICDTRWEREVEEFACIIAKEKVRMNQIMNEEANRKRECVNE